ncbi:MAG: malonyl-CoA decarboxylase [Bryobacterales bacterium]|nr:malonyl-CoA decarboxylase [Bryobacterales bacterium]
MKVPASQMKLAELLGFGPQQPSPSPRGVARTAKRTIALCHSLLSERGEVSGGRLAAEALEAYQTLDERGRRAFFELLIQEFSPDPQEVGTAGDAYRKEPSPENLARLQKVVEPLRQELFRRLNLAPDGTRILVAMRSRVLQESDRNPLLKPIAADLAHLFTSWFNRGFLVLRRIDWRTSAVILEKLIRYEAVHQIQGWHDLRRRLETDRRCYAFFHPALPDEPIIFIEGALTRGLSENVQALLDPDSAVENPETAEWAIFYSITNCQEGLRGVPFGSFLIKRVVEDLSKELPRIKKFATVSPIPGFRRWLAEQSAELQAGSKLAPFAAAAAKLDNPRWMANSALRAELERYILPMAAYYLLHAKQNREPQDPVARFHLKNGARLERINWLGDTSTSGWQRSAGLSANYIYKLADVERNHELYVREQKVRASREIEALAKRFAPSVDF